MPRESKKALIARAEKIYDRLDEQYPDAHCALIHRNPFELLVATILSAQCTDERVNKVTPELFQRFPGPDEFASATQGEVEELVRSTGFFRNKARNLIGMADAVVERHGGQVPATMAELRALPGVGRKTANVVLGNAFGIDEGVVVDTHVRRLSRLLMWTRSNNPDIIERDLVKIIPRKRWTMLSHLLIFHGREVCRARRPRCEVCPIASLCPSSRV